MGSRFAEDVAVVLRNELYLDVHCIVAPALVAILDTDEEVVSTEWTIDRTCIEASLSASIDTDFVPVNNLVIEDTDRIVVDFINAACKATGSIFESSD